MNEETSGLVNGCVEGRCVGARTEGWVSEAQVDGRVGGRGMSRKRQEWRGRRGQVEEKLNKLLTQYTAVRVSGHTV